MSEIAKSSDGFVAYEYKDIFVHREMKQLYTDSYPSFGWVSEGTSPTLGISSANLKFKRDRKIRNKAELTRLQRQFESNVKEIEDLENSKAVKAQIIAFTIGILGTAFLAGSVFALIYAQMIPLMIVLAIPGFVGWVLPYFCYTRILKKRIDEVTPLIESQYDEIADICEKAHTLLD
jgi:hypothetical protein